MFKIINLNSRSSTAVRVSYKGKDIDFTIGTIISKRNKDELDGKQFTLLNEYLNYKGEEFKAELFQRLVNADDEIIMSINQADLHPLPYQIIHPILDMFDLMDIFNYIKNVYRIKAPSNLMEEFDPQIEQDGRGTRIQTYLKDDYYELAALSMIVKVTIGPLCHFAYIKSSEINTIHKEYILFHFFKNHHLFWTAPMTKLLGLVEKLVELPTAGPEAESVRILEKQIAKEDMNIFILAIVVIQRISIAPIVDDNENRNIITKVYNYINNKLKSSGDVSKSVRNKTPLTDTESGGGDKESIIESYRIMTDVPKGESFLLNEK
jgi:hypothetical protein